jgi:hypothetical protein
LYVPAEQAVHVTPLSLLPYPAMHVPVDVAPQPVLFDAQEVHTALPLPVL